MIYVSTWDWDLAFTFTFEAVLYCVRVTKASCLH